MGTLDDLRETLRRIDGRGYPAYKDLRGAYRGPNGLSLHIDHVQGDPFAAPSKLRLRVEAAAADLPQELHAGPVRKRALEDLLARSVRSAIRRECRGSRGSGKSGRVGIDAGGQEVLERTAVLVTRHHVEARIEVGLPAGGRRILGREAAELLCRELPAVAARGLHWSALPVDETYAFVEAVENQEHIRAALVDRGLVAFVGDGSILPRETGASDLPMPSAAAVPFRSPDSLRVSFEVPNPAGAVWTGLGIPEGVTLIVGGGYHGKSTLLRALERSVYPHIPGDGREQVVTRADAVKIRAEDGRRVEQVDISPFIGDLPGGRSTAAFSTDAASGSTSQAANIIEAVEVGAGALLLDEDTSATNFMVRDARMQALVLPGDEPITPFLDRVRELADPPAGVSTVIVMGACGDYFDVADTVLRMREFAPEDATAEARAVAVAHPTGRASEAAAPAGPGIPRIPRAESFDASRGRRDVKISAKSVDLILYGEDAIDLRLVEQLVDASQTRAIGQAIHLASTDHMDGEATLAEVVDALDEKLGREGLDALAPAQRAGEHPGNLARPRRFEIAAAINRLRTLKVRQRRHD